MRLFDVLPNFLLSTSETMRDYYLSTWYVRLVEQRKTISGGKKYQEGIYISQNDSPLHSLPSKTKMLLVLAKTLEK